MTNQRKRFILTIIVLAQFLCCSTWFAVNAVIEDVQHILQASPSFLAHATTSVQLGFIVGTFTFALYSIADRYSPSRVFVCSALLVGFFNILILIPEIGSIGVLLSRGLVGFFLAGIYPVGMKIASDHFSEGLGVSLGYLVAALVLGTALPHLIRALDLGVGWKTVVYFTSGLTAAGGLALWWLVPDGPYHKISSRFQYDLMGSVFKKEHFNRAASGYFGHMWELYTFWAFIPLIIQYYLEVHPEISLDVSFVSFGVIGIGSISCVIGGYVSRKLGVQKSATMFLLFSGICCLISPIVLTIGSAPVFLVFLFFWGTVVIADSPLFSTLVAQNAPQEAKGTALTLVTGIGFALTIVSIQFLNFLLPYLGFKYLFLVLSIGPIWGIYKLIKKIPA